MAGEEGGIVERVAGSVGPLALARAVPLEAGVLEAGVVRQVDCTWCAVRMNQRGKTIEVHEASKGHQEQQQQYTAT